MAKPDGVDAIHSEGNHSDSESSSSSSSSSDASSNESPRSRARRREMREETKKREKVEKVKSEALANLRIARIKEEGQEHFHSHAGLIYVSDDHFMRLRVACAPCHIFVSLQTLEKPSSQKAQSSGFLLDLGPPKSQNVATSPPLRIRIVNKVLLEDMSFICGFHQDDNPVFNWDYVAPFRTIIPAEQRFRQRHVEVESKFAKMAEEQPKNPAVLRHELDWVPESAYTERGMYSIVPVEPLDLNDEVARARLLRDGYRALIHLLDHELSGLVQDHRLIQAGTVEKLPFLHLWHLFKPGQEIVTNETKLQAYRVLQVTGGRKQLPKNKDNVWKKEKISALTIDCFHLDFDGVEFGPVGTTIEIKPYEGLKAIRQLAAYPLTLAADPRLKQVLIERGRKFEGLVGASHRKYQGPSLRASQPFDIAEEIDGDVMVDFRLAYRSNEPSRRIEPLSFFGGIIDDPTLEDEQEIYDTPGGLLRTFFDNPRAIRNDWVRWRLGTELLEKRSPGTLDLECYSLLPARVWGYVFLRRKWCKPLPEATGDLNTDIESRSIEH